MQMTGPVFVPHVVFGLDPMLASTPILVATFRAFIGGHRQHPLRRRHDPADQGDGARLSGRRNIQPLWWCLSLRACLGGNGTLVGAAANLTVAGIGERSGVPFRFTTYTLYAFPMMIASIVICHVYVWWRYF